MLELVSLLDFERITTLIGLYSHKLRNSNMPNFDCEIRKLVKLQ